MSNTVQGVPTPADFPVTAGNLYAWRVMPNGDGTIHFVPNNGLFLTGAYSNTEAAQLVRNPSRYDYEAILSAHAMIDEHDQRIKDAGEIPDIANQYARQKLWWDYFNLSKKQFSDDDTRLLTGKPLQILFSADGIPTYSTDRLAARAFHDRLAGELTAEEEELAEIVSVYGPGKTAAEISAVLPLDPFSRRVLQAYIDAQLPPDAPATAPITVPTTTVVTSTAPAPTLGDLSQCVLRDPSLPASLSNCLTPTEMLSREARLAAAIVQDAPENYEADIQADNQDRVLLQDYFYWKANYPFVALVPSQNPGLTPAALTTPWPGPGLAPLVIVQITPRQRPFPTPGFLVGNSWLGLLVSAIPFVGGILAAGLSYESNSQLQNWAGAWKPNADEFAPQFYPKPFGVPMPLDRAQIMVNQPWYAPAMVDQFAQEVRLNQYRAASDAYALLAAMQNTNQLTSVSALPNSQGAAAKDVITSPNPNTAASNALPLLLAAGLLAVLLAPR